MANRRMFSKSIVQSSRFLRMPPTCQLLYYHLGMSADDDGFVEWYTVVTMTRSSEEDLRNLAGNQFVKIFDDQVLVILDWKENNLIKSDRYVPSKYLDIYALEPNWNQSGTKVEPQVRLGKVRLSNTNTELTVNTNTEHNSKQKRQSTPPKEPATPLSKYKTEYQEWVTAYNALYKQRYGVSASNLNNFKNSREAYSLEDMIAALKNLPRHDWLKDKHTPTLILRQTDRSGQPVDRIGELLSYRVKTLREQLEEQS